MDIAGLIPFLGGDSFDFISDIGSILNPFMFFFLSQGYSQHLLFHRILSYGYFTH